MNILDEIAGTAKERVAKLQALKSYTAVRDEAEALAQEAKGYDFYEALAQPELAVIAELKKASPSKGLICPEFEELYLQQAVSYAAGGAAAISCLTEPFYFKGCDQFLQNVRQKVELPILRKDFTVAAYQIFEAKTIGADAVLLICSILSEAQLEEYLAITRELGMSALVEAHTDAEVEAALKVGARIIGVNNRNLKTFAVNPTNSLRLRDKVPADRLFVAESGIAQPEDCIALKQAGVSAVLIGEALMRAASPAEFITRIRNV